MVKALYNEDNEKYFLKCMYIPMWGFPGGSAVKNLPANAETRVQSLGQEDALQQESQPNPGFLPGKSHGQRSLAGYSLWGRKRVSYDLAAKQQ